jgi:signal transduction histidine kinase
MIERRDWHWIDWMLLSVLTGWFLLGAIYCITGNADLFGTLPWWAGLSLMFLGSFGMLLFWRPYYVNPFWFPVAVLLTVGSLQVLMTWSMGKHTGIILVPLILVGFLSYRTTLWWTVPVFVFGFPLLDTFAFHILTSWIDAVNDVLNYALFYGIGSALGRMYRTQEKTRRLLDENQHQYSLIQQQNKALELYASRIEELTLQTERNRMARELHDTVGHTFTSVIMGMDAVTYLIEAAPNKAKEQLEKLRTVTRNGLEEVRRSIHQMAPQDDDLMLSEQLSLLANEFALQTGTQIRVSVTGAERELPQQMRWTLFRCLQESLTNAKRHGEAAVVEVDLTFEPEQVELRIEDDGIGSDRLQDGFGLNAMRERLNALHGTLGIRSTPGEGTTVTCRIPTASARA